MTAEEPGDQQAGENGTPGKVPGTPKRPSRPRESPKVGVSSPSGQWGGSIHFCKHLPPLVCFPTFVYHDYQGQLFPENWSSKPHYMYYIPSTLRNFFILLIALKSGCIWQSPAQRLAPFFFHARWSLCGPAHTTEVSDLMMLSFPLAHRSQASPYMCVLFSYFFPFPPTPGLTPTAHSPIHDRTAPCTTLLHPWFT